MIHAEHGAGSAASASAAYEDVPSQTEGRLHRVCRLLILQAYPVATVLVLWELVARTGVWSAVLLPPPSLILETGWLLIESGALHEHVVATLLRLLVGFLIGASIGGLVGIAMGWLVRVEQFLLPILNFLMPIPALAWLPVAILWFGLSETSTLFIVAFATAFPIIYNTWTGVKIVDRTLVRAALSLSVTRFGMLRKVLLPGSLPVVISGLRIGLGRAWRALVAAEMLTATGRGLGFMIFDARQFLQSEVMFAGILGIGIVGFALERLLLRTLEIRTIERWGVVRQVRP